MKVQITQQDIDKAGHGNSNDPLARALQRTYGGDWHTETHSRGKQMSNAGAWKTPGADFSVDRETTLALVAFDNGKGASPRIAELTPVDEALEGE